MQIDEGEVAEASADEGVQYVVTSCLTVTCILSDMRKVGAHYSLIPRTDTGGMPADQVCGTLAAAIAGETITKVIIAGQTAYWNSQLMRTGVADPNAAAESLAGFFSALTGCINVEEYEAYDQVVVMPDGSYLQ